MQIEPISVSDINKYIKDMFANDETLANVFVRGEISNFKNHYTGHLYFTLKDEKSLIKCVMFKTYVGNLNFMPKEGMKVVVFGSISCFERDGVYQIYCKGMQEEGTGVLYLEYQKLKSRLEEEGLFSNEHKKKIPFMPKVVGVLTSQTGSVIKDIINVSTRRFPNITLKLYPVAVQGKGAEKEIASGIEFMNENKICDVIILARGGGSLEDLWPFNEEIVARAIYDSEIPIISAIGHETDFTISDFVADLRAPTPSAAAELAVPNVEELQLKLKTLENRMKISLNKTVEYMRLKYEKCISSKVFKEPLLKINENRMTIDILIKDMITSITSIVKERRAIANENFARLDSLSPLKTLTRGFSITENEQGKIVKEAKNLQKEDNVRLRFIDGTRSAKIID